MAEPRYRNVFEIDEATLRSDASATSEEALVPPRVTLPEPMLRYECNQQGCCCGGWRIPFRPDDLVRLRTHLDAADVEKLTTDVEMKIELGPEGERVVKEVYVVDEDGYCRFLESDRKRCGVHAKHGLAPLPNICVDFPVATYASPGGVDFYFDPVCPAVLDRICDEEGGVGVATLETPYRDDVKLRAQHVRGTPVARVGAVQLTGEQIDLVRRRVMKSLDDRGRPLWQHLMAIDHAYAEIARGEREVDAFELRYDHDPGPYLRFLGACLSAHGVGTLVRVWEQYRRFVFAIPRGGPGFDEFEQHLRNWQPAYEKWLEPQEDALRGIHLRYLAHRHFAPFLTIQGELKFASGAVVHTLATALRYAAAFGAVLRRPVDRDIMKVSLGCAEYVYRSLEIPPDSLPWFGIAD